MIIFEGKNVVDGMNYCDHGSPRKMLLILSIGILQSATIKCFEIVNTAVVVLMLGNKIIEPKVKFFLGGGRSREFPLFIRVE